MGGDTESPPRAPPTAACDAPLRGSPLSAATNARAKRGRGAGPRLSDLQRLEIIRRRRESVASSSALSSLSPAAALVSLRRLAREFAVDEKTIRRVLQSADEIERRAASSSIARRERSFRRPSPKFPELERRLVRWLDAQQRRSACTASPQSDLSPSAVIEQAKRLAATLGIHEDRFKASWGWYDKFCKRYGLGAARERNRVPIDGVNGVGCPPVEGLEPSSACDGLGTASAGRHSAAIELDCRPPLTQEATGGASDLDTIMTQYDPHWVFAVDETALMYRHLPPLVVNGMLDAREAMRRTVRPATASSTRATVSESVCEQCHRVTLVACRNLTGTLSLPVAMIGAPRWASRDAAFPVPYLQQDHAWMDRAAFAQWFDTMFCAFIRSATPKDASPSLKKRRVLLIVDADRPGYQSGFELEDIRVVSAPRSLSSRVNPGQVAADRVLDPLHRGWLTKLKQRCKLLMLTDAVAFHAAPAEVQRILLSGAATVRKEELGVHFGRLPTLMDAARSLALAQSQTSKNDRWSCSRRAASTLTTGASDEVASEVVDEMKRLMRAHVDSLRSAEPPEAINNGRVVRPLVDEVARQVESFLWIDSDDSPALQHVLQLELQQLSDENGVAAGDTRPNNPIDQPDPPMTMLGMPRSALLDTAQLGIYLRSVRRRRSERSTRGVSDCKLDRELEASIQAADQIRRCVQRLDGNPRVDP